MPSGKYRDLLKSLGFQSFLWTQFASALNDNIYETVIALIAADFALSSGGGAGRLSATNALFMLPFFLFSGYAGHVADAYSKRTVLILTKAFEIVVMLLGFVAFLTGEIDFMLAVVFLMALRSTFFSPAKYGIVPEMVPARDLSRANGLLEMSTLVAIIAGTAVGSSLLQSWKGTPARIGLLLTAIAAAGTLASLKIPRVPAEALGARFRLNPFGEIWIGLKHIYKVKPLWHTVLGISYFWFLGALLRMDVVLLGKEMMGLDDRWSGILMAFSGLGIGVGSIVAGRLSGDKVELGLVPLGSIGMGVCSMLLAASTASYWRSAFALVLLGFSTGLFIVPLNAYLQQRSGDTEKGRLIATNNFLNMAGALFASAVIYWLHDSLAIKPQGIILILGLTTLAGTVYSLLVLPDFLIRFSLWLLTHTIYRIRIVGQENVPFRGPALLVSNHMSMVDGLLVGASLQRFIRFMIYRPYYELKIFHWLFSLMKAIPVAGGNRREVVESLRRAQDELREGHVVCIFAEGAISRTGNLLPFKRGFERIVAGIDVPIIPVHLDRLWGSIFSFKRGRFFFKWPEHIPYPVTVSFGKPLPATAKAQDVRQAILELGSDAVEYRRTPHDLLHLRFLRNAKRRWFHFALADSTGVHLTWGGVLIGAMLLAGRLRRRCTQDEKMVGLLLPASAAGAISNVAVLLAGRVPVNLNFTVGRDAMDSAIRQCGIRTTITSRAFLAKAKIEPRDGMLFVEELMRSFTAVEKAGATARAALLPTFALMRLYNHRSPDDLATVIFSSGSTGEPKGVMLSHHNVLSNVEALAQVFWVSSEDRLLGVLPFFHSFGFTVTLWFPLACGVAAVYHPNPTDAKAVGEMARKHRATLLLSTPTFIAAYLRRCTKEEFATLRFVMVGGEKLREATARAFQEKYGLELCEGYGATEMSPVVSANFLDVNDASEHQTAVKPGTVGHPVPGVVARVIDPDTGATLAANAEGLLLVRGPNRMLGYLEQPEKTRQAFRDGWYDTGDIAAIDEEGFIRITDRLSRFSKIGGEMVPHIKIEEAVNQILGEYAACVTAAPDESKGERLVVLYTRADMTPADLWHMLSESGLPNLWIPKQENIHQIESLPMLGSGKLDIRQAKSIAAEKSLQAKKGSRHEADSL